MNRYLMQRIIQYVPALIEFDNLFGFSKESMTTHQHQKEKRVIISSKQSITPIHVILADDDEDDRDLFTEAMREINIKVQLETLKDGNSLLDRLLAADKKLPDLLFLDLNMPDKNGRECLDIIRNTERLKDINLISY